ncbi:MAG: NmrA/HSCARG family protein [Vicinamibacterales bacterium]|nr:NmrA/HSCARG family protein [Vicinamibacterales bacterium]
MGTERTVLVTGATGKQGGAVARALKGKGFKQRAMTRKPDSDAAKRLAAVGVEIVQGDLNDAGSLKKALSGVWGVFAVQNTWEAGVEGEEEQGKRLAMVAREAGVQHFVYTSVGSADRKTGIPHFENKFRVEDTVRGLGFPSHIILRPVFFMENLPTPWFLNGDNLYAALPPAMKLQMIAVDDIGKHGARAFTEAEKLNRQEIDIAGDEATMPEAAAALSKGLRRTINFVQIPIEDVRKNSEDFALMLEWFVRVGYDVDIPSLARESGIRAATLSEWAARL